MADPNIVDVFTSTLGTSPVNLADPLNKMVSAGSSGELVAANRNAVAAAGEPTLNLAWKQAEDLLQASDAQQKLSLAQRESTQALGSSLQSIWERNNSQIEEKLKAGEAAATAALEHQANYAKLSEQQNTSWNPLKKVVSWWQAQNEKDSTINKMTEATAYFKQAAVSADTTKTLMERATSQNQLTQGLQQMLMQQQLQADQAKANAENAAFATILQGTDAVREKILGAGITAFDTQQKGELFRMQKQQNQVELDKLADVNARAEAVLWLQGKPITKENMKAAHTQLFALNPDNAATVGKAMLLRSAGLSNKSVYEKLTAPEVQVLGNTFDIPDLKNFGKSEMDSLLAKRTKDLRDAAWQAESVKKENAMMDRSAWEKQQSTKDLYKQLQEQAVNDVYTTFNSKPAKDIIGFYNRDAQLPAMFNFIDALNENNSAVLNKYAKTKEQRDLLLYNFQEEGGMLRNMYSMYLTKYRTELTADQDGPHVQLVALMAALKDASKISKVYPSSDHEIASFAADLAKAAAARSITDSSPTISILRQSGYSADLTPRLPAKVGELTYYMDNPADALKVYRLIQQKTNTTWSLLGGSADAGKSSPTYQTPTKPLPVYSESNPPPRKKEPAHVPDSRPASASNPWLTGGK